MSPYFSIVMAVHNAMPYLPETMASLLGQTMADFEIIVVDDHSDDATLAFLKGLADHRLQILSASTRGQTPALNAGIRAAQSRWIARMDGDDWCAPDRLAEQRHAIESAKDFPVLVTSDYWICDEHLTPVGEVRLRQPNPRLRRYLTSRNNPICHPTVCMRRSTTLELGGYDETLVNAQDIRLWHKLLAQGSWLHVSKPLVKYRVLRESLSVRFQPEQAEERQAVLKGQSKDQASSKRKEADQRLKEAIYHYKLGFAAWVAGERNAMRTHLTACLRQGTFYGLKAGILLAMASVLPRRWYLNLGGYRGVFA